MRAILCVLAVVVLLGSVHCSREGDVGGAPPKTDVQARLAKYTPFRLTADLSGLSENQKAMLPLLMDAARAMDDAFWMQAYGDREALLASLDHSDLRRFAEINYGPWDRLDGNAPFVPGAGPKPIGANLYPNDMTKVEFEAAAAESPERGAALRSLYTVVVRDPAGALATRPYSEAYADPIRRASEKLAAAAELAEDPGFRKYLELRSRALLEDEYLESDLAWMDMKDNEIDIVVGPIETYEERVFGYKASFEAYVLIKDLAWSDRLARYAAMLPELQRGLPVPDEYKKEMPGTDADLNAYDVVYYAGDCNAGSKTIAINLPNDERVQLRKGSRRLQLKNAMRAKFDKILAPIAGELIADDQRSHVTFDAFFSNTMFHEVAHGLGLANTLDRTQTVREAMKDHSSGLEEGKADILGLYMVTRLHEKGELGEAPLEDYYVTFLASIFRSSRLGAASAHGRANMLRFNFFERMGAFSRDAESGMYRVEMDRMRDAMAALSEKILRIQGDGSYDAATAMLEELGGMSDALRDDLARLSAAGIPVDIVFEQGERVLGL